MKLLIAILFAVAALAYVARATWERLTPARKTIILGAISHAAGRVRDGALAIQQRAFRKQHAFRNMFLDERGALTLDGQIVLSHLTRFCYALNTTGLGSPSAEERLTREGRRQVWIEMMRLLSLDPADALNAVKQEEIVLG